MHGGRDRLERARPRPTATSAAAATAGSRSSSTAGEGLRVFALHHHLLPVPGTGRERNVVYDAGDAIECLQRSHVDLVLSGHKHVPYAWRLEDIFVVNAGTVSTLRLRGKTRPCYNVIEVTGPHVDVWRKYPFHGQERIIQFSTDTRAFEKYTARIEGEVTTARDARARDHRRRALRPRPSRRARRAAVRVRRGPPRRRDGEAPRRRGLRRARSSTRSSDALEHDAEVVVDLSDEPVLGPPDRLRLASRALALGLPYVGADFRFDPPALEPFDLPSLGIVGTGKRVGKTAVAGHAARVARRALRRRRRRHGPRRAPGARGRRDAADRSTTCSRSRAPGATPPRTTSRTPRSPGSSRSAAAAPAAGSPARRSSRTSTRAPRSPPSARRTSSSSRAAAPRSRRSRRAARARRRRRPAPEVATGYLNAYRILVSDLVVLVRSAAASRRRDPRADRRAGARGAAPRRGRSSPSTGASRSSRPRPRTRATHRAGLDEQGADVVHVSTSLARPRRLRAELESVDADTYLVELKAAAIDVVAEAARRARRARSCCSATTSVAPGLDERAARARRDGVGEEVRA